MKLSEVLKALIEIRDLKGNKSIEKKWSILKKLIDDTKGEVLKCFDKHLILQISDKTIEKLQPEYREDDLSLEQFLNLNKQIKEQKGNGSVERKTDCLKQIYSRTDSQCWGLLDQFYSGCMKIGFNEKLIYKYLSPSSGLNSAFEFAQSESLYKVYHKQFNVGKFKPMLADVYKGKWENCYMELKLDGIRTLVSKQQDVFKVWTRNGTQITKNFLKCLSPKILSKLKQLEDFVIDGEIWLPSKVAGEGFRTVLPLVKSKEVSFKVFFCSFDLLFYKGEDFRIKTYEQRRNTLEKLKIPGTLKRKEIKSLGNFLATLEKVRNSSYEGLVIKKKDSIYEHKRTQSWLKIKPVTQTIDVMITKGFKGTGKYKDYYSSFRIAVLDKGNLIELGEVGSGFTQKEYEQLYSNHKGRIIEIRAEALTTSKEGLLALRFPRFIRFRDDKKEPNDLAYVKKLY